MNVYNEICKLSRIQRMHKQYYYYEINEIAHIHIHMYVHTYLYVGIYLSKIYCRCFKFLQLL